MCTARGRLKVAFEPSFPRGYSSARYARRKIDPARSLSLINSTIVLRAMKSQDMNDFAECQSTPRFTLSGYSLTIAS